MKAKILAISLLMAPLAASAEETPYFGIGLFQWTYDEDGAPEASASTFRFTIGRQLTDNVSIEGQFATGGSDTVSVFVPGFGTANVEAELDSAFSIMLRPHSSGDDFRVYGLIGFTQGELTFSSGGFSSSEDDSGISYGVGVEAALTDDAWFTVDYVNYLRDDLYTFDAFTIGTRLEF